MIENSSELNKYKHCKIVNYTLTKVLIKKLEV